MDAATDIYVVATYYSEGLNGQANAMLGMISVNLFIQILIVLAQYQKKRWTVKLKEALITLLFLRPIVDAYRVATTSPYRSEETTFDSLSEMVINKVSIALRELENIHFVLTPPMPVFLSLFFAFFFMQGAELACESIPGCVLQIFILMTHSEVSRGSLVSIGISALTTGFTSAMISFDKDVDAQCRKKQPKFYGELFPNYFCCSSSS